MINKQYPIGKFKCPDIIDLNHLKSWKQTLAEFSEKLNELVSDLNDEQLDTVYREGGWTIR